MGASKILKELMQKHVRVQRSWLQQVLFSASTLLGILVSLRSGTSGGLYSRLCFSTGVVLLALGILQIAIALYAHVDSLKRIRKAYAEEAAAALREDRATAYVSVRARSIFGICETGGYACLMLALLRLRRY